MPSAINWAGILFLTFMLLAMGIGIAFEIMWYRDRKFVMQPKEQIDYDTPLRRYR